MFKKNFTYSKKIYIHEISSVNLSKIYFFKNAKKRCQPNNRDLIANELFCKQWEVIFKEVHVKMAQGLEKIVLKISTQFKLLELAEKETERLLKRNKNSEIEKYLQHVELKLEKLQEFKYSAQEVLLEEGKMGNLEKWSSVMEKQMVRFDDVADRL